MERSHSIVAAIAILLVVACNKDGSNRNAATSGTTTTAAAGSTDRIEFGGASSSSLPTSDVPLETCTQLVFKAFSANVPVTGETLTFSISTTSDAEDKGALKSTTATTDDNGEAVANYCSGKNELTVTIVAQIDTLSANSGPITIAVPLDYEFKFKNSDVPVISSKGADKVEDLVKDGVIRLNLAESGPSDCTKLRFQLTRKSAPVAGKKAKFTTQIDFPKGAKLASRSDTGKTEKLGDTNKIYGYYETTSDADGIFTVPVCAGSTLGSLLISSTIAIDANNSAKAQAPVLTINSGYTNWANLSLTYDVINAKTLRGYFNTNSDHVLKATVQLNAKGDAYADLDNPVIVMAETGKVEVENGGFPSTDGKVHFTVQALHMVDYLPFQKHLFGNAQAQTRCDPEAIATAGGITYPALAQNWRSTIVYMMRGQEHFHDANRNGKYDVGGDGFWDKNQNGVYDTGDVITYDAGNDGNVDINSEWFIDLPSPFIDVDEDGVYTANKDILAGEEYTPPNGKRDTDTLIWKYDYWPIYMGETSFALRYDTIGTPTIDLSDSSLSDAYYTDLVSRNLLANAPDPFEGPAITATDLWGGPVSAAAGGHNYYVLAHGLCGSPVPGGTEISVNVTDLNATEYGARTITANFYQQPEDYVREPSRRLLATSSAGSTAKIGFNIVDHPASVAGYPIAFDFDIGPCTNACTGEVATPGVACAGRSGKILVTIDGKTMPRSFSFGAIDTCTCTAPAVLVKDACVEP